MHPLTKRQAEIYEYIRKCITEKRYSPSISGEFDFKNPNGAWGIICRTTEKGWLTRNRYGNLVLGKDSW